MPGLTSPDKESYQKLYDAADGLQRAIASATVPGGATEAANLVTLQSLTSTFFNKLKVLTPELLSSFDQLQAQVGLTGGYLAMYQLFTGAIDQSDQKAAINEASQELLMQYNQLKTSLEAIDDDFLDDLIPPCSDPLFLGLLADVGTSKVKSWTQQLLSDQAPMLADSQVQELIDAWGRAVTAFVKDTADNANKVKPGEPKTIAHFFCIHDQLEELYSELSTSVALNS